MATSIKLNVPDDSGCQAILNEAADIYCQLGTTGNYLYFLVRLAYARGLQARATGEDQAHG